MEMHLRLNIKGYSLELTCEDKYRLTNPSLKKCGCERNPLPVERIQEVMIIEKNDCNFK